MRSWQDLWKSIRRTDCRNCGLYKKAQAVCLCGQGPVPCDLMIIGEAPGFREDEIARPFSGKAGQLLDQYLKEVGLDRSEVFITNAVKCRPPNNRTPTREEVKACLPYLLKEIEIVRPKFILLLGGVALQTILNRSGIKKYRGMWREAHGAQVLATYHPAALLRNPSYGPPFKSDLTKFVQVARGYNPQEKAIHYVFVRNKRGLQEALRAAQKASIIAYDIETDMETDEVLCLGFFTHNEDRTQKGYFVPLAHPESPFRDSWKKVFSLFGPMVARVEPYKAKTVAQNGKFDNGYFLRYTKWIPNLTFDTMLAAHLLDENSPHDLGYIAQTYCNAPSYKDMVDKKKLRETPIKILAQYNMQDCYWTLNAYFPLKKKLLQDPRLTAIFKYIVMPGARALERAEHRGMWINRQKLEERITQTLDLLKKTRDEMIKYLPPGTPVSSCENCKFAMPEGICYMYDDDGHSTLISKDFYCDRWKGKGKAGKEAFNFNSNKQLAWLMFDHLGLTPIEYTKTGTPSTAEGTLVYLNHPFIDLLLKYRSHSKVLSTYLRPWSRMMDENDRIHTSFKLHGTVTGRLSSAKPNIQNIPRDSDIRTLVGAPPGWVFVEADYSQIELRIVAHMAQERTMMRIYATGGDIHVETACTVTGKRPEDITKEERKRAKAVNFGFVYGMGWKKFKQYAKEKYGVEFTDEEAKETRRRFFQKYKDLLAWHDRQRRIAHKMGYVRSPLGRKRRLPDIFSTDDAVRAEAERQAINSPVQAVPPDLSLLAIAQLVKVPGFWEEIHWVSQVHDALLFEVREDRVEKWLPIIKRAMENPPVKELFGVEFLVPIEVEIKVGKAWGQGEVWKGGE